MQSLCTCAVLCCRVQAGSFEPYIWHRSLDRGTAVHEAVVVEALVPAAAPTSQAYCQMLAPGAGDRASLLLNGSGSGTPVTPGLGAAGSAVTAGASVPQGDSSAGPAAAAGSIEQLSQAFGVQLLSSKPPLVCRGAGYDFPDPDKLATRGQQEALLPGISTISRRATTFMGANLVHLGLGYARQAYYCLLFAAAAQHVGGSILSRLALALVNLLLATGVHPFKTTGSSSPDQKGLRFAFDVLAKVYPGLQLPADVLTDAEMDLLAAHCLWWTAWTSGYKAALSIMVPKVSHTCLLHTVGVYAAAQCEHALTPPLCAWTAWHAALLGLCWHGGWLGGCCRSLQYSRIYSPLGVLLCRSALVTRRLLGCLSTTWSTTGPCRPSPS